MVQYFGPKHLEQTTLSYIHCIENVQAKPRQHYLRASTFPRIYNGLLWEWLIVNINILATYTNVSSCQIHCILTLFQATG